MDSQTIIITNNKINNDLFKVLDNNLLLFNNFNKASSNFFIEENDSVLILVHSNYSFIKYVKNNIDFSQEIYFEDIINNLQWGFVLIVNKKTKEAKVYNDVYGIYPLYIYSKNESFTISNNYDWLVRNSGTFTLNENALYDYFLFNYTLNENTFLNEINQLIGGSEVIIKKNILSINKVFNFDEIVCKKKQSLSFNDLNNAFSKAINSNIDDSLPIEVPLTGGFDSKIVLASALKHSHPFSTYCFGVKGSVDDVVAQSIAAKFNIEYEFLELSDNIIDDPEKYIQNFIRKSPNNPVLITLFYYELVNEKIQTSNIITGKMGGEIITGPVIISEVVATRTAKTLITTKSNESFLNSILGDIDSISILKLDYFKENSANYISSINNYFPQKIDKNKSNYLNFLANELYAKFFGIVFKNLMGNYNLINPFMDISFLKLLLNSKYSITKNRVFSQNPFTHLKSRRLYAKMVNKMYPDVLNTYLDRGYKLKDVISVWRFPIVSIRYFYNHFIRRKRNVFTNHKSDLHVLKEIAIKRLPDSPILNHNIIDREKTLAILENLKTGKTNDYTVRKIILLLGLHYFYNSYKDFIK